MAVLPLTQGKDNPILRTVSEKVKRVDKKIKKLITDMIDTMEDANGLGIAAPQVGVNLRIFIVRFNHSTPQEIIIPMINAEITSVSDEMEAGEEGCLSLPGKFGEVKRHKKLTVSYFDQKNNKHTLHLEGLNARIIQHETGHIDGHLYIDFMEKKEDAN